MKHSITHLLAVSVLGLLALATQLAAQTSVFTYQGSLTQNGQSASGTYDFMFRLMNAPTDGSAAPVIPVNPGVGVTNGLFTTGIDFGAENLNGANLWLEISVRTNGGGAFTTLVPRQLLTSALYAVRAANVSASGISGTYGNAVTFNNAANSFAGSGAGLTALNATALTQGTVPPAALNNAWKIGGNAGTTVGTHFLGTTDNQPLEFNVNGQRGLRIEATAGTPNVIGGSAANTVGSPAVGAVIAGGGTTNYFGEALPQLVFADYGSISGGLGGRIDIGAFAGTVGGGYRNQLEQGAAYSVIAGGVNNGINTNASYSTIAGGAANKIGEYSIYAAILGGESNSTDSQYSTVSGGNQNRIFPNSNGATIGGGINNTILSGSPNGTIPGGQRNSATNNAFAAGFRAKAIHAGSFVWADIALADLESTAPNSVSMRAAGGYRLFSNSSATAGVSLASNATAWSVISDRAVKKDFAAVDGREVLEKLAAVPVQRWHYQWESADATPHLGPVAQDFKAAFYPGRDDKSITTLEFDGVALAAIQGLNQKLEDKLEQKQTEITELQRQNAELLKRLEAIEARLR